MSNNNTYATPNQGLAAFFVTQGESVAEISKRPSKYGGDSYFFVFNTPIEQGRSIATLFYDKQTQVEPFQYYEEMKNLRIMLRETRAKETQE